MMFSIKSVEEVHKILEFHYVFFTHINLRHYIF